MAFTVVDIPEEESAPQPRSRFTVVDIPEAPSGKQPRQRGMFEKVYDASGSILQGLTFGFGDELTAGVGGALGGNYDEILAKDRGAQKQYEAENPYESMMFEIGGGLPLAFATPGAGAGALTKLATMGSQARSAKGLMGAGAAYGALTGAGKGEGEGDRLAQALLGGTVGAAVPGAVKLGGAALKPVAQRIGRSPVASTLANEAGAILPKAGAAPLSAAETRIFQQLRNVPTEQLTSMQDEMARALTEGTPLYLQESGGKYGKRELTDFARYIANRKGGANFAEKAIGERAEQAGPRISSILDELSPQSDPRMGGFALMDATKGKIDELKAIRQAAAEPYYQRAMEEAPRIDPEDLTRFMRGNGKVKGIINGLRELPQWADAPDNSRELMHRVKVQLDEKLAAEDLLPMEKAELTQIKNSLVDLLEQVDIPDAAGRQAELTAIYGRPQELTAADLAQTQAAAGPSAYGAGRYTFHDKSAPIDEILKGPLGGFLQANASPENVGTSVLNMSPSAIEIGIGQLGSADAMRAAARSGLSKRLGSRSDTANLAEALVGKENPRKMLATLMGSDGAENILRRLELEDRMAKAKNLYNRGSTTASNQLEEETFNKSGKVIDRLIKALSTPMGAAFDTAKDLRNLGLASGKEDLARALAGILFDSQQGAQSLEKIIPYATRRNQIAGKVDDIAAALAKGARPLGVNSATRQE